MIVSVEWVALSLIEHLGSQKLARLTEIFDGDLRAAIAADEGSLRRVPGIGVKLATAIRAIDLDATRRRIDRWQAAGVRIIPNTNPAYPQPLLALKDPPPTLFVLGNLPRGRAAAVVGTREPSGKAYEAAKRIGFELAQRGWIVVSGLALGIDTGGHYGALASPGGKTLAVLGGGLLDIYPSENRALARAIRERGALVCEVSPDARPSPPRLVARNRLISAFSEAVIVAETDADGGAMHAARWAVEQGRRVYTLDSGASGNRDLISAGARVISPNLDGFDLE